MIKRILFRILYPLSKIYLSKERTYKYNDITVKVLPEVFHPGLFFSTKILLNYLKSIELNEKTLLEFGAGTGLISIFVSKQNAKVTATDINPTAIKNIELNAKKNDVELNIIQSDLFDNIPPQIFEIIIINPPYFPKDPKNNNEYAWFCGSDFRFFKNLFTQIGDYISASTKTIMILSEDCDIEKIKSIAKKNSFALTEIHKERIWNEWNYLFNITPQLMPNER
ncbi:MAG: methyltransferase [Bacteroidetes bacterium]|nr:methyltransferase [Bacteroidota bacterium]